MNARGRWMILFVPLILAAGYISWLLWRADDDGKWLFSVFTAFFILLSLALWFPKRQRPHVAEPPQATRFAGSWVLPTYLLIFGALVAACLLIGFFKARGK